MTQKKIKKVKIENKKELYQLNERKNQLFGVLFYVFSFFIFNIVGGALITFSLIIDLGMFQIFAIVGSFCCVISLTIYVFQKLSYVNNKNFVCICIPFDIVLIILTWLFCFMVVKNSIEPIFILLNEYTIFGWALSPIICTIEWIVLMVATLLNYKKCPNCLRKGFGIAVKNNYIIEKITKEFVETKKYSSSTTYTGTIDGHDVSISGPTHYSYEDLYQNYEHRLYTHYCSICGEILFKKRKKVKSGKKYAGNLEEFTDSEKTKNEQLIEKSKQNYKEKEENIIIDINTAYKKITVSDKERAEQDYSFQVKYEEKLYTLLENGKIEWKDFYEKSTYAHSIKIGRITQASFNAFINKKISEEKYAEIKSSIELLKKEKKGKTKKKQ